VTPGRPATLALAAGTAGFTLLEILVVLVLLGLLTGFAAARFSTLRQPSLAEAGRDVMSELRAYRSQAMQTGKPVQVAASGVRVPAGFVLGGEQQGEAAGQDAPASVLFLPDGRSSGAVFVLSGNNEQERITVDWLTGEVRVGS
jgi:prepilin-type N-terminal cleavage/methylation domain-containing protein